jgi:hypothetical protein
MMRSSSHYVVNVTVALLAVLAAQGKTWAGEMPAPCDADSDGDVDLHDHSALLSCMTGPGVLRAGRPACEAADQNLDRQVDLEDVAAFQICYSGNGIPAAVDCVVRPISIALECPGGDPPTPDIAAGPDLHKVTLNAPRAICNDGTPAVMYIRRAANPASATRWVIYLQAGGSCIDYETCLVRWCGYGPQYDASKMSSLVTHESVVGHGLFDRDHSALASANLVFIYYCSSDSWTGRNSSAVLTSATDPTQSFLLHFRGHSILEAAIDMLITGPVTSDDGQETLPPLATATDVLFAGSSAGSAGARHNIDWVTSHFDPHKTRVRGAFDAGNPLVEDFPDAVAIEAIIASIQVDADEIYGAGRYNSFLDESCMASLEGVGGSWRCTDPGYVSHNHITTPYFTRNDRTDPTNSNNFEPFGVDIDEYAVAAGLSLSRLPDIRDTAVEAAAIDFIPGVYGPNCGRHIAFLDAPYFFVATVDDANGQPHSFDQALRSWLQGNDVYVVDEHPAASSTCPP